MKTILFFHPSADMYGSDKVLLSLVTGLDSSRFRLVVILPCEGPLSIELYNSGVEFYIIPLLRVVRAMFNLRGIFRLLLEAWRSIKVIKVINKVGSVDLVHSNTLAVLSGALWAKLNRVPHVWHVHEMIENPWIVRKGYGWLLRLLSDSVIFNSYATRKLILHDQYQLKYKTTVVWNGLSRDQPVDQKKTIEFRQKIGITASDVLVALLGRINRWKGQKLLVEAAELIEKQGITNVRYIIVGSPPQGQEHYHASLLARIERSSVRYRITVMPFISDIWTFWDACDIAVVPSTEPEPFGMVALEAMASKKPVIAAKHGGLAEIVVHDRTGILFEPNSAEELEKAIKSLIKDKKKRILLGENGFQRSNHHFSLLAYISGITAVYDEIFR